MCDNETPIRLHHTSITSNNKHWFVDEQLSFLAPSKVRHKYLIRVSWGPSSKLQCRHSNMSPKKVVIISIHHK